MSLKTNMTVLGDSLFEQIQKLPEKCGECPVATHLGKPCGLGDRCSIMKAGNRLYNLYQEYFSE